MLRLYSTFTKFPPRMYYFFESTAHIQALFQPTACTFGTPSSFPPAHAPSKTPDAVLAEVLPFPPSAAYGYQEIGAIFGLRLTGRFPEYPAASYRFGKA